MMSAARMVESRWAMTSDVRPSKSGRNATWIRCSDSESRIVETRTQAGDGGLAGSGGPDQRGQLTWLDREGHVLDGRPVACAITEGHLIELDLAARLLEMPRLRLLIDRDR